MRFDAKNPPRRVSVGNSVKFDLLDCGSLALEPNEQVTFTTPAGGEYDLVRKDWGFYATPSLNGRLRVFGLRGVLIRNTKTGRYFVLLVEGGHDAAFDQYMWEEGLEVIAWLDSTAALDRLRERINGPA